MIRTYRNLKYHLPHIQHLSPHNIQALRLADSILDSLARKSNSP
eukprot:UN26408